MKPRREVPQQDGTRRNEQIRAREVRVIGAEGEQIGILSKQEAIDLAKEHGLDLVEVAATADPPVCRIMDFGKFKYEQQQRKKNKRKTKLLFRLKKLKSAPKQMITIMKQNFAISAVSWKMVIAVKSLCFLEDGKLFIKAVDKRF